MNRLAPGGFAHERQSLRVVEELENEADKTRVLPVFHLSA